MPAGEIPQSRCREGIFQLSTCLALAPNPCGAGTASGGRTGQLVPPHELSPSSPLQSWVPCTLPALAGRLRHWDHRAQPSRGSPGSLSPVPGAQSRYGDRKEKREATC